MKDLKYFLQFISQMSPRIVLLNLLNVLYFITVCHMLHLRGTQIDSNILYIIKFLKINEANKHHASSSIPSTYCLASFIRPACWQFGRVVSRLLVRSLHHARSSQHSTFAHGSMCIPPHTPSSQSLLHYTCTLARTHFAFFQSLCTMIYYFVEEYNKLYQHRLF
jgi:hypothetical protein